MIQLEDRITPSWSGVAPVTIAAPAPLTAVILDGFCDAQGTAVIAANEVDFFRFTARATGDYDISVTTPSSSLVPVAGVYNSANTRVGFNDQAVPTNAFTVTLAGGQAYTLAVTNLIGAPAGSYSWVIASHSLRADDSFEPNNSQAAASDLGTLAQPKTITGLSLIDGVDWYKFTTVSQGTYTNTFGISFTENSPSDGELDMDVLGPGGLDYTVHDAGTGADMSRLGPAGTYYVRVYSVYNSSSPNYTLTINAPPKDDAFEPNNSQATAANLGSVTTPKTWNNLRLFDSVDWYKFTTVTPATYVNTLSVNFTENSTYDGEIDIEVIAPGGLDYIVHDTGTGADMTRLAGAGTYYVRVFSVYNSFNPSYSLTINAPPLDDAFENNDTQATATNLGTLTATKTWNNLRLLDAADWYKFTTVTPGTYASTFGISFTEASQYDGELDMEVTGPNGLDYTVHDSGAGSDTYGLNGYAAGTYYIRVFSQYNSYSPSYSLTINAPPLDDAFENNDTQATATNLGTLTATKTWNNLRLLDSADWYKFTTVTPGTYLSTFGISFTEANSYTGDLDMEVVGPNGLDYTVHDNGAGSDTYGLNGYAAGTYYIRVFSQYNSYSPSYSLTINAPPPDDAFENNDTQATATNLGTLTATKTWNNLRLLDSADWYKFTTVTPGTYLSTFGISFTEANSYTGDLDMEVVGPNGLDYTVHDNGTGSDTYGLNGYAAGTYYIRVFSPYNSYNPSYSLTINAPPPDDAFENNDTQATATSLGILTVPKTINNLRLLDAADWYTFTTVSPGTAGDAFTIHFSEASTYTGELDMEVIGPNNLDYTVHDYGAGADTYGLDMAPAGTYYVRVFSQYGSFSPNYSLTVTPPPLDDAFENNNTQATATNLGSLIAAKTINHLRLLDSADWYKFSMLSPGTSADSIGVRFTEASTYDGELDIEVIGPNALDYTTHDQGSGTDTFSLSGYGPGLYYVHVFSQYSSFSPDYSLTINAPPAADKFENNNTQATATNLGLLAGNTVFNKLNLLDDADWYKFTTGAPGTTSDLVQINFLNAHGNLDLAIFDVNGVRLAGSTGTNDVETIGLQDFAAGTYWLEVTPHSGALDYNENYSLTVDVPLKVIADDTFEPDNSFGTAASLGTVVAPHTWAGLILADSDDWYKFSMAGAGTSQNSVSIQFVNSQGDLDLELYNSSDQVIGSSAGAGDSESISLSGDLAGVYYVHVFGFSGAHNPNYSLTINPGAATDDALEPNNTQATAYNFGAVSNVVSRDGLRLLDSADWYRFTLAGPGDSNSRVQITFQNNQGDLDLDLVDSQGVMLGSSTGTADYENIWLNGIQAGTYYVKVYGKGGAVNAFYHLNIIPGGVDLGDWYDHNLHDAALRALVRNDFANDHLLNRADFLGIFQQVELDNVVSANEFTDLKTLVTSPYFTIPPDVENLASKVILGNRANAYYQGVGQLHFLAAGSSGARLQQLVDKWFLGMDHPGTESSGGPTYAYQFAFGTLFNTSGTPVYTDIVQGQVGDCYLLSALGGVALKDPNQLENNFIDNGDNTFTIRFFNNGVADYVAVDRYLPASANAFVYANYGATVTSPANVLWVALAEKAYVQISQEGWTGQIPDNVYDDISGGLPGKAVLQIAGYDTMDYFSTNPQSSYYGHMMFAQLEARFDNGEILTFGSNVDEQPGVVVPNHAYLMVSYDDANRTITLFNPWGTQGGNYDFSSDPNNPDVHHCGGYITVQWPVGVNTQFDQIMASYRRF